MFLHFLLLSLLILIDRSFIIQLNQRRDITLLVNVLNTKESCLECWKSRKGTSLHSWICEQHACCAVCVYVSVCMIGMFTTLGNCLAHLSATWFLFSWWSVQNELRSTINQVSGHPQIAVVVNWGPAIYGYSNTVGHILRQNVKIIHLTDCACHFSPTLSLGSLWKSWKKWLEWGKSGLCC